MELRLLIVKLKLKSHQQKKALVKVHDRRFRLWSLKSAVYIFPVTVFYFMVNLFPFGRVAHTTIYYYQSPQLPLLILRIAALGMDI